MKKTFKRFCALILCSALILQGCTYHGKIRRGIYKHPDFQEKINARVMVVSDKYFPKIMTLDYSSSYFYRLADGLPVAVADALGTLFTEVDVNEYKYRKNYDYIVEVDYKANLLNGATMVKLENVLRDQVVYSPVLYTALFLTFRNPKTGYAVAKYGDPIATILPNRDNDAGLWLTGFLRVITLGLLTPLDMQVYGSKIRKLMEAGITDSLSDNIMPKAEEDRVNFTKDHETEKTNVRVDGKYIPFMKATVYIYTGNSIGSGFFISSDGYIITNAHVVKGHRDVSVVIYDEHKKLAKSDFYFQLPDYDKNITNKVRFAKVLKFNDTRDLALIKVEGENFPFLELETDRNAYVTGKEAVAIGAPYREEWTVSQGVISATRDYNGRDLIQMDTPINRGNSGGPLILLETGKVIGVNSMGLDLSAVDEPETVNSINYAISAYEVQRTLGVSQPVNPDDFPHPAD